jgi:hypothetical protein
MSGSDTRSYFAGRPGNSPVHWPIPARLQDIRSVYGRTRGAVRKRYGAFGVKQPIEHSSQYLWLRQKLASDGQ